MTVGVIITGLVAVCWLLNVSATCYSVSQGQICSDKCTPCYTEIKVADQALYLIRSQCYDTRLTSPSADSTTPGAWRGSHRSTICKSLVWLDLPKDHGKSGNQTQIYCRRGACLTTMPSRQFTGLVKSMHHFHTPTSYFSMSVISS